MNDDDVTLIILFLHTTLIASIVFAQRRGTLCLFGRHLGTGEPHSPKKPSSEPPFWKSLLCCSDTTTDSVKVWDATTGKTLFTYTGQYFAQVFDLAWSPDGASIASASYDKTVQIWNPTTGQTYVTYTGHAQWVWAVAWSPNGKRIYVKSS